MLKRVPLWIFLAQTGRSSFLIFCDRMVVKKSQRVLPFGFLALRILQRHEY